MESIKFTVREHEDAQSAPTISFCTTCFNRSYQLKQTFDRNADIVRKSANVEWVILNYNSQDDLDDFMKEKLPASSNRIVYAREWIARPWHLSVAKNMAHRLGSGDILMSLDCDNLIAGAIDVISRYFASNLGYIHMWSGIFGDGTCGRIAVKRNLFYEVGGYDESFFPMGFQDLDFVQRVLASGYSGYQIPSPPGITIKNSKTEGIKYCGYEGLQWDDFDRANRAKSFTNITSGRFVANIDPPWTAMAPSVSRGGLIG